MKCDSLLERALTDGDRFAVLIAAILSFFIARKFCNSIVGPRSVVRLLKRGARFHQWFASGGAHL